MYIRELALLLIVNLGIGGRDQVLHDKKQSSRDGNRQQPADDESDQVAIHSNYLSSVASDTS